MSALYYLGWTDRHGLHHHDPAGLEEKLIRNAAGACNAHGVPRHVALSAAALEAWKETEAMETAELARDEMMTNTRGEQIPARLVQGRIKLEDQTVRTVIKAANAVRGVMRKFKDGVYSDLGTFREMVNAQYGVRTGGSREGTKLHSFDGLMRVEVSSADTFTFGPELEPARELINACIRDWTAGANGNLKALVDSAFRVGVSGKIQVDRVLELRNLDIDDDRWREAMVAINDALRVQGSRRYVRFYERETVDDPWVQIALNMSAL
jgi:hypothetical protein